MMRSLSRLSAPAPIFSAVTPVAFVIGLLASSVGMVPDKLDSPDAVVVAIVAREDGRVLVEDEDRAEIFELFRWFRLGTGV